MPLDAARDAVIGVQARVSQVVATENIRLAGQVASLAARVERRERLASRNSANSSRSPAADDLSGRTAPPGKPSRAGGKRAGIVPGLEREA